MVEYATKAAFLQFMDEHYPLTIETTWNGGPFKIDDLRWKFEDVVNDIAESLPTGSVRHEIVMSLLANTANRGGIRNWAGDDYLNADTQELVAAVFCADPDDRDVSALTLRAFQAMPPDQQTNFFLVRQRRRRRGVAGSNVMAGGLYDLYVRAILKIDRAWQRANAEGGRDRQGQGSGLPRRAAAPAEERPNPAARTTTSRITVDRPRREQQRTSGTTRPMAQAPFVSMTLLEGTHNPFIFKVSSRSTTDPNKKKIRCGVFWQSFKLLPDDKRQTFQVRAALRAALLPLSPLSGRFHDSMTSIQFDRAGGRQDTFKIRWDGTNGGDTDEFIIDRATNEKWNVVIPLTSDVEPWWRSDAVRTEYNQNIFTTFLDDRELKKLRDVYKDEWPNHYHLWLHCPLLHGLARERRRMAWRMKFYNTISSNYDPEVDTEVYDERGVDEEEREWLGLEEGCTKDEYLYAIESRPDSLVDWLREARDDGVDESALLDERIRTSMFAAYNATCSPARQVRVQRKEEKLKRAVGGAGDGDNGGDERDSDDENEDLVQIETDCFTLRNFPFSTDSAFHWSNMGVGCINKQVFDSIKDSMEFGWNGSADSLPVATLKDHLNDEWSRPEDTLIKVMDSGLLTRPQVSTFDTYIGTHVHMRLALTVALENFNLVTIGRDECFKFKRNITYGPAVVLDDDELNRDGRLKSVTQMWKDGDDTLVSKSMATFIVGDTDGFRPSGAAPQQPVVEGIMQAVIGAYATPIEDLFRDEARLCELCTFGGHTSDGATVCGMEIPVYNPYQLFQREDSDRYDMFTTQIDAVIHSKGKFDAPDEDERREGRERTPDPERRSDMVDDGREMSEMAVWGPGPTPTAPRNTNRQDGAEDNVVWFHPGRGPAVGVASSPAEDPEDPVERLGLDQEEYERLMFGARVGSRGRRSTIDRPPPREDSAIYVVEYKSLMERRNPFERIVDKHTILQGLVNATLFEMQTGTKVHGVIYLYTTRSGDLYQARVSLRDADMIGAMRSVRSMVMFDPRLPCKKPTGGKGVLYFDGKMMVQAPGGFGSLLDVRRGQQARRPTTLPTLPTLGMSVEERENANATMDIECLDRSGAQWWEDPSDDQLHPWMMTRGVRGSVPPAQRPSPRVFAPAAAAAGPGPGPGPVKHLVISFHTPVRVGVVQGNRAPAVAGAPVPIGIRSLFEKHHRPETLDLNKRTYPHLKDATRADEIHNELRRNLNALVYEDIESMISTNAQARVFIAGLARDGRPSELRRLFAYMNTFDFFTRTLRKKTCGVDLERERKCDSRMTAALLNAEPDFNVSGDESKARQVIKSILVRCVQRYINCLVYDAQATDEKRFLKINVAVDGGGDMNAARRREIENMLVHQSQRGHWRKSALRWASQDRTLHAAVDAVVLHMLGFVRR